jgi:hypothetical protein
MSTPALSSQSLRRKARNGSAHCGTVRSIIVYSVRIGPPQPKLLSYQQHPRTPPSANTSAVSEQEQEIGMR